MNTYTFLQVLFRKRGLFDINHELRLSSYKIEKKKTYSLQTYVLRLLFILKSKNSFLLIKGFAYYERANCGFHLVLLCSFDCVHEDV